MLARNRCSHVPSLGRSIVTGLGVLLALISSASPSQSQVLDPHVSVNGKLFDGDGGCSAAPGRCSGPVSFDDVGTYEFLYTSLGNPSTWTRCDLPSIGRNRGPCWNGLPALQCSTVEIPANGVRCSSCISNPVATTTRRC